LLEQQSVDQLVQYLDLTNRIAQGGMASATDVLKTQVQLSNAKISLQQVQEAAATAKYNLSELIGETLDTTFSIAGSLDSLLSSPAESLATAPDLPAIPLDISMAENDIHRNLLDMEITRHEKFPVISLYGSAGLLTSVDNLRLPPDERITPIGFLAGVSFDLPIFNWGATDLRVQEREFAVNSLRDQSALLYRSLNSEFRKTRLSLAKAKERLSEIRGSLQAAEENYRLTTAKFAGGGALSLEVLSAQQLLNDTRMAEVQALADIQNSLARLEQLSIQ
jgi:outer membrane protein TolC